MLTTKKTINISGESTINGVIAERFTATINEEKPENMVLNQVYVNRTLAKENRETCRADRAEFEDLAYALQDELGAGTEEETEE